MAERFEDLRRNHNLQRLVLALGRARIGLDNIGSLCSWRRRTFFKGGGVRAHLCNLLGLCQRCKAVDDGLSELFGLGVQSAVRGFGGGFTVIVRNAVGGRDRDITVEGQIVRLFQIGPRGGQFGGAVGGLDQSEGNTVFRYAGIGNAVSQFHSGAQIILGLPGRYNHEIGGAGDLKGLLGGMRAAIEDIGVKALCILQGGFEGAEGLDLNLRLVSGLGAVCGPVGTGGLLRVEIGNFDDKTILGELAGKKPGES